MKILYLTSVISSSGGVPKTLALKSDYLIEQGMHQVEIVYNEFFEKLPFYHFNKNVKLQNLRLDNTAMFYIFKFKKAIQRIVNESPPDVIVVSDNGLKGFLIPLILKTKIPIILEIHGSKREIISNDFSFLSILKMKLHLIIKSFLITKFDEVVFLSSFSSSEWGFDKAKIIPNALSFESKGENASKSKIAVAIGRHSYEKGLDRLIPIWKKVSLENPEWKLKIYGQFAEETIVLKTEIKKLNLQNCVELLEPVKDIQSVYNEASIFLMSSRFEGFGLALLEAMSCGLAVMAYDCPVGPQNLIENNKNGLLIPNDDAEMYVEKLKFLIQNRKLQLELARNAINKAKTFKKEHIMNQWETLLKMIVD